MFSGGTTNYLFSVGTKRADARHRELGRNIVDLSWRGRYKDSTLIIARLTER